MKKALGIAAMWMLAAAASAEPPPNVLFIVDISGSMSDALPGVKRAIRDQAASPLLAEAATGLVSFHGCGPSTVSYVVPLAKSNGARVAAAAGNLSVQGATDIVAPLVLAERINVELLRDQDECLHVVLFTDDEDSCGNGKRHLDLLRGMNRACAERSKRFRLDVVTSTVDETIHAFLDEIAEVAGGQVVDALGLDEISIALRRILENARRTRVRLPVAASAARPQEPARSLPQPEPARPASPAPLPARPREEDKQ